MSSLSLSPVHSPDSLSLRCAPLWPTRDEGTGGGLSTWLLILRHGDLRGRALKSELLAQKSGAPCRMVSGRDVNSTQWVAEKNGTRKYPTNACSRSVLFFRRTGTREKEKWIAERRWHKYKDLEHFEEIWYSVYSVYICGCVYVSIIFYLINNDGLINLISWVTRI